MTVQASRYWPLRISPVSTKKLSSVKAAAVRLSQKPPSKRRGLVKVTVFRAGSAACSSVKSISTLAAAQGPAVQALRGLLQCKSQAKPRRIELLRAITRLMKCLLECHPVLFEMRLGLRAAQNDTLERPAENEGKRISLSNTIVFI